VRHHQRRGRVESRDQEAAVVVDRRIHGPAHHRQAPLCEPASGGGEQRVGHGLVVHGLEEPVETDAVAVLPNMGVVLDRCDPAHRTPVAHGEERLQLGVLEERVLRGGEQGAHVRAQRRDPQRVAAVVRVRKSDEAPETAPVGDGRDLHTAQMTPSSFPSRPKVSSA
jgi:hypothetical protein